MIQVSTDNNTDLSTLEASRRLPLPDGNTCNITLGIDPDPVDIYWCDLASAIASDPDGVIAQRVALANTALASGDFTAQDISWFLPTKQIKHSIHEVSVWHFTGMLSSLSSKRLSTVIDMGWIHTVYST
jgi:hypothetical protein